MKTLKDLFLGECSITDICKAWIEACLEKDFDMSLIKSTGSFEINYPWLQGEDYNVGRDTVVFSEELIDHCLEIITVDFYNEDGKLSFTKELPSTGELISRKDLLKYSKEGFAVQEIPNKRKSLTLLN